MNDNSRAFGVSCHVDYWGSYPVDPLIDPYCTDRQEMYAIEWAAEYIYTPQLVVNGLQQYESTGSSATVNSHVADALQRDVTVGVTAWLLSDPASGDLDALYRVVDPPDGFDLVITVVERGIVHEITGGENAGETLIHDNVWRAIEVLDGASGGEIQLELPDDAVRDDCSVIAWVQDHDGLEIVGATQTHLFQ